ncbi:AN1-type zinc finger protein 1 [Pyxicephalus adspersus]|uniref:AN1-type zinc finger protein 1 n=1 Tax=Pyxicephalus adspersus TaxID=30357 RepID=UPI003B5CDE60
MAELEIGQHCDVEHCGQLDFLPFVCDGCSKVYCLVHKSKDSHGCIEVPVSVDHVKSEGSTQYPCTYKGCSDRELVEVLCPFCEKHFCFRCDMLSVVFFLLQKLRLCHPETGQALPLDSIVEKWLSHPENALYSGGNIIIEYLDNDCSAVEDPNSYLS